MYIEELRSRKEELGYSNRRIAELSGVPKSTVDKIFGGLTKAPRYETLTAIRRVLLFSDSGAAPVKLVPSANSGDGMVREPEAAYNAVSRNREKRPYWMTKPDGEYTIEDYEKFPDDVRAELIDGYVFVMDAPTIAHQHVAALLYMQIHQHIMKRGSKCVPFIAPTDVVPSVSDNKTIVEPDVFVVCDRSKLSNGKRVMGAPDLVIEVLSPSTRRKDLSVKLQKYIQAGVREYWVVDPEKEVGIVYGLEDNCDVRIFGFGDKVPIGISGGELSVDFAQIRAEIAYFSDLTGEVLPPRPLA